MKIKFISHASVIVYGQGFGLLTDPWFFGGAFNDSWKLWPEPKVEEEDFNGITHVFISHEHPDHFHIPTLKSLPVGLKERVVVLFQKNNSEKMKKAFLSLGFKKIELLENKKQHPITKFATAEIFQIGGMDSCLILKEKSETIVNLNDCEPSQRDCLYILKKYKKIDLVLNQFSMAGYEGFPEKDEKLSKRAEQKLNDVLRDHFILKASKTMPFASNIYFSCEDNEYMNQYANTPRKTIEFLEKNGAKALLLFPGESHILGEDNDNKGSLAKYEELQKSKKTIDKVGHKTLNEITEAFEGFVFRVSEKYPNWLLKKLGDISVFIPDLNRIVVFSFVKNKLESFTLEEKTKWDLEANSQPVWFAFKYPYGVQTLGVSARAVVFRFDNWLWYRLISSLYNAEVYLRLKYLFKAQNIRFFYSRLFGGLGQLVHRLKLRGYLNKNERI